MEENTHDLEVARHKFSKKQSLDEGA